MTDHAAPDVPVVVEVPGVEVGQGSIQVRQDPFPQVAATAIASPPAAQISATALAAPPGQSTIRPPRSASSRLNMSVYSASERALTRTSDSDSGRWMVRGLAVTWTFSSIRSGWAGLGRGPLRAEPWSGVDRAPD